MLNVSFIYDKTSPGKGGMIGTVYRNYHCSALIIIFVFPGLLPKILRPSNQERTCPTLTYACLAKHNSKWPIGTPRLNLVPTAPTLYKVASHHVLVGIPTLTVHNLQGIPTSKVTDYTVLVLNSKESTTAYTEYTTVLSRF